MSWIAQYNQGNTWHNMNFTSLVVNATPGGLINGEGADEVGQFTFNGTFSNDAPTARILKQYKGQHAIYYEGTFDQATSALNGHWGFKPGSKDGLFRLKKQ